MIDAGERGRIDALASRVAALDPEIGHLKPRTDRAEAKLDDLSQRLARLEERVDHLPSLGKVAAIVTGAVVLLGTIIALQGKIQSWLGL